MKPQIEYQTDPTRRCRYCKGRLVRTFLGNNLLTSNLIEVGGALECKDKVECKQNIEAENTQIVVSDRGYKIVDDYGASIMEVEFKKDNMLWEDKNDYGL